MIQIVRYSETPVGPYDELLIIPGDFKASQNDEKRMRITRIYVNQSETCYNGTSWVVQPGNPNETKSNPSL